MSEEPASTTIEADTPTTTVESTDTTPPTEEPRITPIVEPLVKTKLKIIGNKTDEAGAVYVIFLENPLQNGSYSLEIKYEATVDDRVVFMNNYTKKNENR